MLLCASQGKVCICMGKSVSELEVCVVCASVCVCVFVLLLDLFQDDCLARIRSIMVVSSWLNCLYTWHLSSYKLQQAYFFIVESALTQATLSRYCGTILKLLRHCF
jgi:hypothetical protein